MVIVLGSSIFEKPHKKPTGVCDEFCEAVKNARAKYQQKNQEEQEAEGEGGDGEQNVDRKAANSKAKKVPLEKKPVVNITDAKSSQHLVVLQREVGMLPSPDHNNNLKKYEATENSVLPSKISSIDATTCLIVALRNPLNGSVTVAHLDDGKQTESCIGMMLRHVGVAIPKTLSAGMVTPSVTVKLVGAVRHHEFSAETLAAFVKVCCDIPTVAFDFEDGFDVCVWNLNAGDEFQETGKNIMIQRRGLMIDMKNPTECVPVECADRSYPDAKLRNLRFLAEDGLMASVSLFQGEEIQVKITRKEKSDSNSSASATSAASASASAGSGEVPPSSSSTTSTTKKEENEDDDDDEEDRRIFKFIVRPFKYKEFIRDAGQRPLDFFGRLSTSPQFEPKDFALNMKSTILYGNLYRPDSEVGAFGPAARPRVYIATKQGWEKI